MSSLSECGCTFQRFGYAAVEISIHFMGGMDRSDHEVYSRFPMGPKGPFRMAPLVPLGTCRSHLREAAHLVRAASTTCRDYSPKDILTIKGGYKQDKFRVFDVGRTKRNPLSQALIYYRCVYSFILTSNEFIGSNNIVTVTHLIRSTLR